jgi:hypothetical protein
MNKLCLLALCAVVSLSISVVAQRPPAIVSPEVQPDGRVIFRLADPNALKVEVEIEGQSTPTPMQKDEHGTWSVTAGPLQPDFYGYSFSWAPAALCTFLARSRCRGKSTR